jgi:lysophospholipase L1-like esterase
MRPIRFLALGDSYTIGEGVPFEASWPAQLATRLRALDFPVNDPLIVAQTGWTTDQLHRAIIQANIKEDYDLVALLIGVNNQYRSGSPKIYRQEFHNLLSIAIKFAGGNPGHVMVLSIPDWSAAPFAQGRDREKIRSEIDTFNLINKTEAEQGEASYIDVTTASRQAASLPGLIAKDGLHPSGKMYAAWVDLVLPIAVDILENKISMRTKQVGARE